LQIILSFVGLQLYGELYLFIFCHHHTHAWAFHIDTTTLADGTYEMVPESKSEQREAQVNLTEATEDPNQVSEEPRLAMLKKASPGA
jgi:hypothetical protein